MFNRTLNYEYTGLDDTTLIESNYKFLKNPSNISKAFKSHVFYNDKETNNEKEYYRPILTVSFMLDIWLTKNTAPKWYHLSNIIYHILACCLLFNFLCLLNCPPISSLFLSLLLLFHPIVDQAVAWIPGRNDILLAIFVLSSMLCLVRYIQTDKKTKLILHFIFFGFSLFTKENGLMLMPLSIFYLFLSKKHFTWYKFLSGYFLFIIPWFFLRKIALENSAIDNSIPTLFLNFITNFPFIFQYIGKSIIPIHLSVMCMIEDSNLIREGIAILLMLAGIYFSKNKNLRIVIFGLTWFTIFLIPSFSSRLAEGFEHRLYVPLIGLIIICSELDGIGQFPKLNTLHFLIPISYLIIIAFLTNDRLEIFKNKFNFNESAMLTSPKAVIPCINLAGDYLISGDKVNAEIMYIEAKKRDSIYTATHRNSKINYHGLICDNLGVIYMNNLKLKEAEREFISGAKTGDVYSIYHLGVIYYKTGRIDSAISRWKEVIKLAPNNEDFKAAYHYVFLNSK